MWVDPRTKDDFLEILFYNTNQIDPQIVWGLGGGLRYFAYTVKKALVYIRMIFLYKEGNHTVRNKDEIDNVTG